MPENVPAIVVFGCPAGVTSVPLNVKCRIELYEKPMPDTLTGDP